MFLQYLIEFLIQQRTVRWLNPAVNWSWSCRAEACWRGSYILEEVWVKWEAVLVWFQVIKIVREHFFEACWRKRRERERERVEMACRSTCSSAQWHQSTSNEPGNVAFLASVISSVIYTLNSLAEECMCWTATNAVISDAYRPLWCLKLLKVQFNPFIAKTSSAAFKHNIRTHWKIWFIGFTTFFKGKFLQTIYLGWI